MARTPGDKNPEPPGGRAAGRLREFIDQRFPGGLPPEENPLPEAIRDQKPAPVEDEERVEETAAEDKTRADETGWEEGISDRDSKEARKDGQERTN